MFATDFLREKGSSPLVRTFVLNWGVPSTIAHSHTEHPTPHVPQLDFPRDDLHLQVTGCSKHPGDAKGPVRSKKDSRRIHGVNIRSKACDASVRVKV